MIDNIKEKQPNRGIRKRNEMSFLNFAIIIAKYKKYIIVFPFIVGIVVAIYSLTIPTLYTANTVILPPQQQSSATAMLASQLGALAGGAAGLNIKNPNDVYLAMLKSRSLQDNMTRRYGLMQAYNVNKLIDARSRLDGATKVAVAKDGLITVSVDDTNPKRAAILANGYIEELQNMTQVFAVTEASQRRLFYEKQLLLVKQQLSDAEIALKQSQELSGLIQLDAQANGLVQATANIKAQISMKEVQLVAMRSFATNSNPDYIRTQQEINGLRSQLVKVETGTINYRKAPSAALEYIRKVRDVKYYEAINELLGKQYEMAKLDESRQSSLIQVLDKAEVPEKRSKPKRSQLVLLSVIAGFIVSLIGVFVVELIRLAREDDEFNERLRYFLRLIKTW